MYDDVILNAFLDKQLELYPETVADTPDEAREFLEDTMAAVAESKAEVWEYLEEVGVDTEGLSEDEVLEMPEVMDVGDGRYLILEI
ncbi:MAG: glyoxalase [Lachnospiraceae bacterium]|nr:glyoxalase [Lachnospiraceae bacterium]